MEKNKMKCKLCGELFNYEEMSEEHYPARSVGNEDIVAFNITKMLDFFQSEEMKEKIENNLLNDKNIERISGDIFDNELAESLYPRGRTARTLCRKCNTGPLSRFRTVILKKSCRFPMQLCCSQ